jgi:hypothetical protein
MKFETFKKLIKPHVEECRNYATVFEIRSGVAIYTNGYFILTAPVDTNLPDGVYQVSDNCPSQVKMPHMAPFLEKDFSGGEDWSEVLPLGSLIKPGSKRKLAIVLKDGRVAEDGVGINLRTLNLMMDTGCIQIFCKDTVLRARNRDTNVTIFSATTYETKKGK